MSAEAEHGQGDEGVGGFEPERYSGDEPDLIRTFTDVGTPAATSASASKTPVCS